MYRGSFMRRPCCFLVLLRYIRMKQSSLTARRLLKLSPIVAACGLFVAQHAMAHGMSYTPPSRALLCNGDRSPLGRLNEDCGGVQYDFQSVENHTTPADSSFPTVGPVDGHLPSGGDEGGLDKDNYQELDAQTATRWHQIDMKAGESRTFTWAFTAQHPTKDISYYITKPDWNPNKPLTKDEFDPKPICTRE